MNASAALRAKKTLQSASRGCQSVICFAAALLGGKVFKACLPAQIQEEDSTVKGDPKIIAVLNDVLKAELTAINQYFLHAEMCVNWGYYRLAGVTRKESIEEMTMAESGRDAFLYLKVIPNITIYSKINMASTL